MANATLNRTPVNEYQPDVVYPPGDHLLELLEDEGMTQAQLAERMNMTPKAINELIRGKTALTPETALKLEYVFGMPAHVWNNLEIMYREYSQKLDEQSRLSDYIPWAKHFPLAQMKKLGLVPNEARTSARTVKALLQFFGAISPEACNHVYARLMPALDYRKSVGHQAEALMVWLRLGELAAKEVECQPFDEKGFLEVLKETRALTREPISPPLLAQVRQRCAQVGVIVAFVHEIKGARACGVTRWIGQRAILQISLRYRTDDHFWFTFFHEAGHILKHGRKEIFLEFPNQAASIKEEEANQFATNFMIPRPAWRAFRLSHPRPNQSAIEQFAAEIGISPSIVLGQLQHTAVLPHDRFRQLKQVLRDELFPSLPLGMG